MEDRQHRAVGDGIEKLVRVPGGRQWPGFRFAVADHAGDDQIGIVERRAEGVAQRIAQFAAFVDRSRRGRRDMAGNSARKRELLEQLFQTGLIQADVRIDLALAAFEIDVADQCRAAMAGAGDIDHVEVVLLDHPVQVDIDEVLAGRCAQWPTTSGFTCSSVNGSRSRGLS